MAGVAPSPFTVSHRLKIALHRQLAKSEPNLINALTFTQGEYVPYFAKEDGTKSAVIDGTATGSTGWSMIH